MIGRIVMGDKEDRKVNEDLRKSTVHIRPEPSTGPPDIIDLNPDSSDTEASTPETNATTQNENPSDSDNNKS